MEERNFSFTSPPLKLRLPDTGRGQGRLFVISASEEGRAKAVDATGFSSELVRRGELSGSGGGRGGDRRDGYGSGVLAQRQFDICHFGQLCTHQKATTYVLRTQVELEDGFDEDTCELVNGIELSIGAGGDIIHAYLLKAVKNNNGRGLLLLSDVFGFEDSSTRDFAYRIACSGYNVLVPDLFRGNPWKKEQPVAEFERWLSQQPPERVARDIELSTKWLIDEFTAAGISKKLGVVGFCFGGGHLIEALAKDSSSYFATGVCFYGTRISTSLAEQINVPVLFICGDIDPLCPTNLVLEMEKRIKGSRAVIYHGRGHGFAHQPESQEEDRDAEDAFNVLRGWLKDGLVLDEDNAVESNLVA